MPQQLPLGLSLRSSVDFGSFIIGRNGEAISRLRTPLDPFVYLWGESGSGKSHIAGWLAEQLMAIRIRSDVERKRLFPQAGAGMRYTSQASDVCYAHLAGLAARLLRAGFVVVVDATTGQ